MEELEKQIAAVARDIDILNQKIAEVIVFAKERDKLRQKLQELLCEYQAECFREKAEANKVIFMFNGKTKDLLTALHDELQKAQM
jgi:regulator of replication initiation timing